MALYFLPGVVTYSKKKYRSYNSYLIFLQFDQIEQVWERIAGSLSIVYPKRLPYEIFLKNVIIEMKENGQLHQIKKKWEMTKPDCSPLRQQAQCSKIQKFLFWIMHPTIQAVGCIIQKRCSIWENFSNILYWFFFLAKN